MPPQFCTHHAVRRPESLRQDAEIPKNLFPQTNKVLPNRLPETASMEHPFILAHGGVDRLIDPGLLGRLGLGLDLLPERPDLLFLLLGQRLDVRPAAAGALRRPVKNRGYI